MATFKSKRSGVANRWTYPEVKPTVNPVGWGKRNRREMITFDVVAQSSEVRAKKEALLRVSVPAQSTTFTSYREHANTCYYKGPQIMGNRAQGSTRKGSYCKRWSSK